MTDKTDLKNLQLIVDLRAQKQSFKDIADQIGGVHESTAKRRFDKAIEDGFRPSKGIKHEIELPASEDPERFREDWSKEDCIAELKRIYDLNPEIELTRNYFRNHARCSEATWNRYFGKFAEFKRAANLTLSRHAQRLELNIARHASTDIVQDFNLARMSYGQKWYKRTGKRYQSMIVVNDIHDVSCCPFYRRMFLTACMQADPDIICLNGDIFDLPEFGKYSVDPRTWDVKGRIEWVHTLLQDVREICPDAEMVFVEGNHEFRLNRHLTEQSPALKTILGDLMGLTIADLFGLNQFEIRYVAKADLKAFNHSDIKRQVTKNYEVFFDQFVCHHFPQGSQLALPGCNGHHHQWKITPMFNEIFKSYQWIQVAAGHVRDAEYCDGRKWSNGFLMVHMDTQNKTNYVETIDTTNDFCVLGGQFYDRLPEERGFKT